MPNNGDPAGRDAWLGVAVAALAVAVYVPALAAGFNADDFLILWRIKSIAGLADPFAYFRLSFYDYFRPLAFLSYALDWHLWGPNAFGFHVTNIGLHAVNSVLVFSLARKLFSPISAFAAAAFFAVHPASHEVVYWIAARFDLLATLFGLIALLCLSRNGRGWRGAGVLAFALALLSKESAISLLIIVPAWDALIGRRSWQDTARRLVPLIVVAAAYALARNFAADLSAAGGERRLPKLVMTAVAIAGVLWLAWRSNRNQSGPELPTAAVRLVPATITGVLGALLFWPKTFPWTAEKLGFLTHVAFYSLTPIVFPSPPAEWFAPETVRATLPHLAIVAVLLALGWIWLSQAPSMRDSGNRFPEALFVVIFIAAALLPVSSMTGGLRYLYLPAVGVALFGAGILERLRPPSRRLALGTIALMLVLSAQQLVQAGRAWRTASAITRDGVTLMASSLRQCGADDVLLLTTPVGVGGVYANLSWDAFDVLADCAPRNLFTLLRAVRSDIRVIVSDPSAEVLEIRVPSYTGNIVASRDLRNFGVVVESGQRITLDTPVGRVDTFPEGSTQVFRLTMTAAAQQARRFYYSDGRIRR